jgi:hypothetical protein
MDTTATDDKRNSACTDVRELGEIATRLIACNRAFFDTRLQAIRGFADIGDADAVADIEALAADCAEHVSSGERMVATALATATDIASASADARALAEEIESLSLEVGLERERAAAVELETAATLSDIEAARRIATADGGNDTKALVASYEGDPVFRYLRSKRTGAARPSKINPFARIDRMLAAATGFDIAVNRLEDAIAHEDYRRWYLASLDEAAASVNGDTAAPWHGLEVSRSQLTGRAETLVHEVSRLCAAGGARWKAAIAVLHAEGTVFGTIYGETSAMLARQRSGAAVRAALAGETPYDDTRETALQEASVTEALEFSRLLEEAVRPLLRRAEECLPGADNVG